MKKYKKDKACKKCGRYGEKYIDDEHVERYEPSSHHKNMAAAFGHEAVIRPEHIARTCRNCGYSWREIPAEAIAPAVGIPAEMLKSHLSDNPGGIKATCNAAKTETPEIEIRDVFRGVDAIAIYRGERRPFLHGLDNDKTYRITATEEDTQ